MKINLEATLTELNEYDEQSLTQRIIEVAPLIARNAFISELSKARNEDAGTPAEPHERITGSDKNPRGSAKSESSAQDIELSDAVVNALKSDVKEHNENAEFEWQRVSLATLKAVWRRGAGAFSVSHRPSQNRQSWAFARVNAFRKIVMGGGNKKYTQDDDLLHSDHPRKKVSKAHDPSCCGDMIKSTKRGGELDLVSELSEQMVSMYTTRLKQLENAFTELSENLPEE